MLGAWQRVAEKNLRKKQNVLNYELQTGAAAAPASRGNFAVVAGEMFGHGGARGDDESGQCGGDEARYDQREVIRRGVQRSEMPAGVEVPRDDDFAPCQCAGHGIFATRATVRVDERHATGDGDAVPCITRTTAQIDIFRVHPEAVAESAERLEHAAPHEEDRS